MELNLLKSISGLGSNWTIVVPGNFGGDYHTDLLFYERAAGVGQFWSTDGQGNLTPLRRYDNWGRSWTHIVPGNFSPSPYTDLLFYDASNGTGVVMSTDAPGTLSVMQQYAGWSRTWSHIVPGNFKGNAFTDLFFYDQTNGTTVTYESDGAGHLFPVGYAQMRRTWTLIIPGNFGGSEYTDLLFFDRAIGQGQFHTSGGAGQLTLLKQHGGWRRTWSHIVPGNFGGNAFTDLLFYDPTNSLFEFYSTDGTGNYKLLKQVRNQRATWTFIEPGFYGGSPESTGLFCFDLAAGSADFYLTTQPASANMPWLHQWQAREGGRFSGDPTVLWRTPTLCEMFGRGLDNILYQNTWSAKWSGWRITGDATQLGSSPVAASAGPDHLTLFATDAGSNVIQRTWTTATGWSMWEHRGMKAIGDPAVVTRVPGSFDLFVRSADNFLWQSTYAGGQWSNWQQVDNQFAIASSPYAVSLNPNHIFVFATAANGTLHCKTWISGTWTNWDSLYGSIVGKPSGVILRNSTLHLFGRGRDNRLYRITYTLGTGWSRWIQVTDTLILGSSPIALANPADANRYDLFVANAGQNNVLMQKSFSG